MNVIIVDDEPLARNRLEKSVRAAEPGAELHIFESAETAYLYVEEHPCDVAMLDIQGMDVDGITIGRKMMEIHPRLNLIFVTGYEEYALDAFGLNASAYLLKPVTADALKAAFSTLRFPVQHDRGLFVRCFGNFGLLFDGEPVHFQRSKTEELFAYLYDRRGSACTIREISCALWEDEGHESYYKQLRKDLIDTFTELGIAHLIRREHGKMSVAYDLIESDLKNYLVNGNAPGTAFVGGYMSQYSWAETTNAWLQLRMTERQ